MPENVTLAHPHLPGREITVRPEAVPHHEKSGWRVPAVSPDLTKTTGDESGDETGETE